MAKEIKETKKKAPEKGEKLENVPQHVKHAETKADAKSGSQSKESRKAAAASAQAAVLAAPTEDKKMAHIKLHGKEFVGVVISDKAAKTVTVEWERRRLIPKYERYERRYSRVYAHNPITINAKLGDKVRIKETRPLSKTKHFVVVEVLQ